MGNYIQWQVPLTQTSWNFVKIEKAASIAGIYNEIASIAITTSHYFDPFGFSTDYYKIRFYDSVNNVYSDYSTPLAGTVNTDVFSNTVKAITVLGTLGAEGPDTNNDYRIYGMKINQNVAEAIVEQVYDYTSEMVGDSRMVSTNIADTRPIKGFIINYSALKILGVLNGIGITKHFNYTSGGLNIQKPFVGQMAAMMEFYKGEARRWQKTLLTRAVITTGASISPGSGDLQFAIINEAAPEGSGIAIVSFDAKNL